MLHEISEGHAKDLFVILSAFNKVLTLVQQAKGKPISFEPLSLQDEIKARKIVLSTMEMLKSPSIASGF